MKKTILVIISTFLLTVAAILAAIIFLVPDSKPQIVYREAVQQAAEKSSTTPDTINVSNSILARSVFLEEYILAISDPSSGMKETKDFSVQIISTSSTKCLKKEASNCEYKNYLVTEKIGNKSFELSGLDFFDKDQYDSSCRISFIFADLTNFYIDKTCGDKITDWTTGTLIKYDYSAKSREVLINNTLGYSVGDNQIIARVLNESDNAVNFVVYDLMEQMKKNYNTNFTCEENSTNIFYDCKQIIFSTTGESSLDVSLYLLPMLYDGQEGKIYKLSDDGTVSPA
ncbi:MAG TPA: hypothetical protein VMD74_00020, partial [Candidatus Methylomirabilis sp.]|nr:hypothetical protein [Candidatus Methylomirabilis sp.]